MKVTIYDIITTLTEICLYIRVGMISLGSLKSKYNRHSVTVSLWDAQNNFIRKNYIYKVAPKLLRKQENVAILKKNWQHW